MGWTGSRDPLRGLELAFSGREQALAFARCQGWEVEQVPLHQLKRPTQTYTDQLRLDWELLNHFEHTGWPIEAAVDRDPRRSVVAFTPRQLRPAMSR